MAVDWENAAADYIQRQWSQNPLIEVHVKHSRSFDQGLTRNSNRLKPYFGVTVAVLILFTTLYALKWVFGHQHQNQKVVGNQGCSGSRFLARISFHNKLSFLFLF
jgi:hypothetical protein